MSLTYRVPMADPVDLTDGADGETTPLPGDAFGALLTAAHEESTHLGVIERDDGLISVHDARPYFAAPDEWSRLDRVGCADARGRVLVVGCGAGRHTLRIQERGLAVTALDRSPGACAVSRSRGVRDVRLGSVDDVAGFGARFDTVLALGNDLALLGSPELAVSRLAVLARVTVRGGRLFGTNSGVNTQAAAPVHATYHARNVAQGKPAGQVRIRARFQRLADPWLDYWFFESSELDPILARSPWKRVRLETDGPGYLLELVNQG